MSSVFTLARPYARAAFELARGNKMLADWSLKLKFAAQVASDARVMDVAGNPSIGADDLVGLFLPQGEANDGAFGNFIRLLTENRRLQLLPEITALFEELKRESERVFEVRVRTATALGESQIVALRAALKKRFDREIDLQQALDPNVLGGAIIDAGGVVIDGSVSGRLRRLQTSLSH